MPVPLKVIKPAGIFDGVQANQLRHTVSELVAEGNNLVLLDLADVNFIDSTGLGTLIVALKMLRNAGGDLYLCSLAAPVKHLFAMTGMDSVFETLGDRRHFAR